MSAKSDDKIYDSIKDFGLRIIKKKYDRSTSLSSISQTGTSTNTNTGSVRAQSLPSQAPPQSKESKPAIHISNSNQKEYNLQYSKKCCWSYALYLLITYYLLSTLKSINSSSLLHDIFKIICIARVFAISINFFHSCIWLTVSKLMWKFLDFPTRVRQFSKGGALVNMPYER